MVVSRRRFLAGGAATVAAIAAACTGGGHAAQGLRLTLPSPGAVPPQPSLEDLQAATGLPKEAALRVWRGYRPDRAGEVLMIPDGFNFVNGGISHSTPWAYTQDVPILWYGPGLIRSPHRVDRPVTSADIAPTIASLVGFHDFQAPDGEPMEEVIQPGAPKPRLVVVMVWDAGGRYVLDTLWPKKWPNLKALVPKGIWYENASAGSSPSNTSPIHATIGTGAFPYRHGMLDKYVRFSDGAVMQPWMRGPGALLVPTFGDHYGVEAGGRAKLGLLGSLTGHMGMLGHGSMANSRFKPLAVLRDRGGSGAEAREWLLPDALEDYYHFPEYVNELPPLSAYFDVADAADGKLDGRWRGHDIEQAVGGFATPARIPYETRAIEEIIKRDGFGRHEWPDVLFLNYKLIDQIGHEYTASSPEMGDSVLTQDADLPRFMSMLDRTVGRGRWVLLLTADHGHSAQPDVSGAFPIRAASLKSFVAGDFGAPNPDALVGKVRPGWIFIDTARLRGGRSGLAAVAKDIYSMTEERLSNDPGLLSPAEGARRVFATAFPYSALTRLG